MPIRGFPNGVVACFDEPNQIGDVQDFDAPRNAPAKNPGGYLWLVHWHIDFFQYELAAPIQFVNVNHPLLSGKRKFWGPSNQYYMGDATYTSAISYQVPGQTSVAEHTLFSHGLGYPPLAFVSYQSAMLMPGVAVQLESDGRSRFVSAFVTDQIVGLREVFTSSVDDIPAVVRGYQVLVFRTTAAEGHRALFGREGQNTVVGRGKVDTSKHYLRRVGAGDTPFDIDRGPTIDVNSGRTRIVTGGNVITEPGYAGAFAGPDYIAVGS